MPNSTEPHCGKCGLVMTPEDSKLRPELFFHDACLLEGLRLKKRLEYVQAASIEGHGWLGHFGIKIMLMLDRELTEEDSNIAARAAEQIISAVDLITVKTGSVHLEDRRKTIAELRAIFDGRAIYAQEIPNEYAGQDAWGWTSPWLRVTTEAGHFKVGWRKRVIVVDWRDSIIKANANDLFSDQDVTKSGPYDDRRFIHAWGYEKAREYINRLHSTVSGPRSN